MILRADSLSYVWRFRGGSRQAVAEVSAEFEAGCCHILCGPSGSGKSTLGLLLAGLMKPAQGRATLDGVDTERRRGDCAFVFQFPESIYFEDSVREEIAVWGGQSDLLDLSVFERVGVNLSVIGDLHPFHLSAGYGRLVATAMQIARRPALLVVDEPTIGLDWRHHRQMCGALLDSAAADRILMVITHDRELMEALGGKAWVMSDGKLTWKGDTRVLLADRDLLRRYDIEYEE